MQSVDKNNKYKTIDKTCTIANITYLVLHIFYLILFLIAKAYIMVYIDAVVILIYLLFFILIKHKKYFLYALLCGNEFFIFISVATIMVGFNSAFHFYLIGLCIVSFFTTYFSKSRNIKGSIVWVGLSVAIYLTLFLVTRFNSPYYHIDIWLETTFFITHALVVFGFITFYLMVFLKYAFSLEDKITNESRTDELTKINNRYALYDYFEDENDKSSLVLALFDIDDFKNVNDNYGHEVGDNVLKEVANIASTALNDSFLCRYGGEEFVVVIKNEGQNTFLNRLEKLRRTIEEETFSSNDKDIRITITIGACKYKEGMELDKWVSLADEKMYCGKNSGKNKIVI